MLIDLTVTLNEQTPLYPGDPKTEIRPAGVLECDGYEDHYVCCGTHVGTHMDAPSHMIKGGKNLDQIALEQFRGEGVCIAIDGAFTLEAVKAADIREGDFVLFATGMSERYHDPSYFKDYPRITTEVAQHLVDKKVKVVGMDMCSPDEPPFEIHKLLLGNEILIIENLTNLSELIGRRCKVSAFPTKLALDAAPVRVVAEV